MISLSDFHVKLQISGKIGIRREFCAMTLMRGISGFHDDAVCLDWSADSCNLMIGSKDLSARVYHNVQSDRMTLTVLSGHRDRLVGAFFSKDGKSAYSVARDGAVFTWTFEMVDWVPRKGLIEKGPKAGNDSDDDMDVDRSDDGIDGRADEDKTDIEKSHEQTLALKLSKGSEKRQKGSWTLTAREFLWEPHTQVTSVDFNKSTGMLVVGFNKGVFGLYEMPGCTSVHRLSVSNHSLNTACINSTGEWLALGSTRLGQLLVWEWQVGERCTMLSIERCSLSRVAVSLFDHLFLTRPRFSLGRVPRGTLLEDMTDRRRREKEEERKGRRENTDKCSGEEKRRGENSDDGL